MLKCWRICFISFVLLSGTLAGCSKWVHNEGLGYDALKVDRKECERIAHGTIVRKYGEELCKDYSVETAKDVYEYSSEDRYPQFIRNEMFMRSRRDMQRSFNECLEMRQKTFNECMVQKGWRPAR